MISFSFRRRDVLVALATGFIIAFGLNIWFISVATLANIEDYLWLARLQEPGAKVAEKIAWSLYPVIGYPWNVRVAVPCGYAVLIAIWGLMVLALETAWRSVQSLRSHRHAPN